MNKYLTISTSAVIFSGLILITGCSSSGGDGAAPGTVPATVPTNATVIDANNAEVTIEAAAGSATALGSVFAVETTQVLSLKSAIDIIQPILKNISTTNVATGAAFSEPCSGGGTISGSSTETDDGTTSTETGTGSFNNCVEASVTINGSVSFTSSMNYMTGGAYSDDISGSITMAFSASDSFSFSNFVYAITGNHQLFTYTISQLTYAIEYVFGAESGGFLVTLMAPIVESSGDSCPESGHIKVTGGNGTTAEGIYNGNNTMTIKANGAEIPASPTICYY